MLRHYFLTALRSIRKQRLYAGINVLGLAVGTACALLIGAYVQRELLFDRFHDKADRIFMAYLENTTETKVWRGVYSDRELVGALPDDRADVARVTSLFPIWGRELGVGERYVSAGNLFAADSNFFEVFDFPVLSSLPDPLRGPNRIMLADTLAQRLFGDGDPLGEKITLAGADYLVTGVLGATPNDSHVQYGALVSFASLAVPENAIPYHQYAAQYVLARPGANLRTFARETSEHVTAIQNKGREGMGIQYRTKLMALADLHFYEQFDWNPHVRTESRRKVHIFLAVGALVLLMGCLNFVIIFTARSSLRRQEVGVRKVFGAGQRQVVTLYFVEILLMALAALVLAVLLVEVGVRLFERLADTRLHIDYGAWAFWRLVLGVLFVVGLLAGVYPAWQFSRFQPVSLMARRFSRGRTDVRNALVVGQFAISLVMMIATGVVYRQVSHLKTADVGFDEASLVVFSPHRPTPRVPAVRLVEKLRVLKDRFSRYPEVISSSLCTAYPGGVRQNRYDGYRAVRNDTAPDPDDEGMMMKPIYADLDFLRTLQPEVAAADSLRLGTRHLAVNLAAANALGLEQPLGREVFNTVDSTVLPVAALIGDFHFASLRRPVEPMVLTLSPASDTTEGMQYVRHLLVRFEASPTQEVLARLQGDAEPLFPGYELRTTFLDQRFAELYEEEDRLLHFFAVFSGLAIFVSCLGLFGLVTFLATQRLRELSLRKVLGANGRDLAWLMVRDLTRLFGVAVLLAVPLAWYLTHRWLEDFAVRIGVRPDVFVWSILFTTLLSLAAVSYQLRRAGRVNPAEALRSE
ncbi:MAG: FtsX-like permease family protein [Catalinimonas sp.]